MSLNLRKLVCHCILAVGVAATLVASASAQGNIRAVTFYTVKPDRIGDFQAEIKQYNALLAKGGSTRYNSVWLALTGSRTYARADYYNKWSDLDAAALPDPKMKDMAADLARIGMRITDCTESWRRVVEEVNPDLSVPDSGKIPTLIRVLVTQVRADKIGDYLALVKSDILPAVKKSGAKDYSIAQARFGESNSVITSVLGFDTWAELDEGIGVQKALGKDGYAGLLGKITPLIVSSEYDIYRFQPELSYLPTAPAK
jgi:hypothetical protein